MEITILTDVNGVDREIPTTVIESITDHAMTETMSLSIAKVNALRGFHTTLNGSKAATVEEIRELAEVYRFSGVTPEEQKDYKQAIERLYWSLNGEGKPTAEWLRTLAQIMATAKKPPTINPTNGALEPNDSFRSVYLGGKLPSYNGHVPVVLTSLPGGQKPFIHVRWPEVNLTLRINGLPEKIVGHARTGSALYVVEYLRLECLDFLGDPAGYRNKENPFLS